MTHESGPHVAWKIGLTLLVTLSLVVAYSRRASTTDIPIDGYFAAKLAHGPEFDIVFAGDSRTYRGIDPESMRDSLGDVNALNFGFSSAAFTPQFLDAAEAKLDPKSAWRVVALGVTPFAFTREAARDNGFLSLLKMTPVERWNLRHFERYFGALYKGPMREPKYLQSLQASGWIESSREPEAPSEAIPLYAERFKLGKADPQMVFEALDRVRVWARQGIRVVAFRVPTSPAMLELENRESGFDFDAFKTEFQGAGGIWIDAPIDRYHSYDGSHLRGDAAREFSQWLGQAIAERVKRR